MVNIVGRLPKLCLDILVEAACYALTLDQSNYRSAIMVSIIALITSITNLVNGDPMKNKTLVAHFTGITIRSRSKNIFTRILSPVVNLIYYSERMYLCNNNIAFYKIHSNSTNAYCFERNKEIQ